VTYDAAAALTPAQAAFAALPKMPGRPPKAMVPAPKAPKAPKALKIGRPRGSINGNTVLDLYGDLVRKAPLASLSRWERRERAEAEAWDAAHPVLVAQLDALVGRLVRLRRAHGTHGGDMDARTPSNTGAGTDTRGIRRYRAGATFRVVRRYDGRLVGLYEGRTSWPVLLRLDWVEVVEPVEISETP
jgi:hypothetical protein